MTLLTITTKQEFEDKVLNSDKPVLVDFWAEWCPPCRAMAPVLKNISEDLDGTADIAKVNIEETADNGQIASEHQVQSIPNMVIFKGGKEADRVIGMTAGSVLADKLTKLAS